MSRDNCLVLLSRGVDFSDGGIERYSYELIKRYSADGLVVKVLTVGSVPNDLYGVDGVTVTALKSKYQLVVMLRMLLVCIWWRFSIGKCNVHATTWRVALPALFSGLHAALVTTVHGREVLIHPKILKPLKRYVFARSKKIIAVSNNTRDIFCFNDPGFEKKLEVVYNGVSFLETTIPRGDKQQSEFAIFSINRLVPRKNMLSAVQAVSILIRRYPDRNIRYYLAGNGPCRTEIEKYIEKENLGESIFLLGRISDQELVNSYSKALVFLHPQVALENGSDVEGFGLTIADSMVFGCVPIVGRDGGPKEVVVDGESGFVVDGSSVDDIVRAVEKILVDESARNAMSVNARSRAKSCFNWSNHARAICSSFND